MCLQPLVSAYRNSEDANDTGALFLHDLMRATIARMSLVTPAQGPSLGWSSSKLFDIGYVHVYSRKAKQGEKS